MATIAATLIAVAVYRHSKKATEPTIDAWITGVREWDVVTLQISNRGRHALALRKIEVEAPKAAIGDAEGRDALSAFEAGTQAESNRPNRIIDPNIDVLVDVPVRYGFYMKTYEPASTAEFSVELWKLGTSIVVWCQRVTVDLPKRQQKKPRR